MTSPELKPKIKTEIRKRRSLLQKCAGTTLNSKLIGGANREFFAKMVVDAVLHLDQDLDIDLIGVKKVPGGAMQDSFLVEGVAFKKTFTYAGFEQQPKKFKDPLILVLNLELELKSEKENAEIRLQDPTVSKESQNSKSKSKKKKTEGEEKRKNNNNRSEITKLRNKIAIPIHC